MLIGLMAATLASVGYGTASVLQAYGARSSEAGSAATDSGRKSPRPAGRRFAQPSKPP